MARTSDELAAGVAGSRSGRRPDAATGTSLVRSVRSPVLLAASADEVAWAERVLGAVSEPGRVLSRRACVEPPVLRHAKQVLNQGGKVKEAG